MRLAALGSIVETLHSKIVTQGYQISIAFPDPYFSSDQHNPVGYALDANGVFGTIP